MIRKKDALDYHSQGRKGKIEVVASKQLLTQRDLSLAYTPGVAEPCLEIARDPELVYEYTAKGNLVAVISNGTAVLGLGDIGAAAGKPVMEGKGVLFKKFADIDVFDIEISSKDPEELIRVIAALEPTFGGINLEDIKAPECFQVERELKKRMQIPVFHDDQHGTAIISGAALLNALEVTHKDPAKLRVVVSGAGASAIACANFYLSLGVRRENVLLADSTGVVYKGRKEGMNEYKEAFAQETKLRTLREALDGADLFLGCSKGGLLTKEMVRSMAPNPIVFALANPDPEISYPDAKAAREDIIIATGRSDYPNQVNNVLGFPFIFRGALDVRAREINEAMKVAAARALAQLARQDVPEAVSDAYGKKSFKFGPDYLIPKPFDARVLWWVAPAVAKAAIDSGVARQTIDLDEYRERLERKASGVTTGMRRIIQQAKAAPKRIVFPEGEQPRILKACQLILDEGIARPILLAHSVAAVEKACQEHDLDLLTRGVEIVVPQSSPRLDPYAARYVELRARKGATVEQAHRMMGRRNAFGLMMVEQGDADGIVSGLTMSYAETIRPALQIIGLRDDTPRATGMYMLVLKSGQVKFFADATVSVGPDVDTLVAIAIQTADAVKELGVTPHVAMLSFSNFGSARFAQTERVAQAVRRVWKLRPDIEIDGELQADTALNLDELREHYPFCKLTRPANVLIFPNLAAGNVAYKLLATLGGATAVGPILLGLDKPVTVLQRHSSVTNIVHMTAFTVAKAQGGFERPLAQSSV